MTATIWVGQLYRRRRRRADGSRRRESRWRFDYRGPDGKRGSIVCYSDKESSKSKRLDFLRDLERGDAGLGDPFAQEKARPLSEHVEDFMTTLASRGRAELYRENVRRALDKAIADMGAERVGDITTERIEEHLVGLVGEGLSYATRNFALAAVRQLLGWGVERERWGRNPAAKVAKLKLADDPRRKSADPKVRARVRDRRALTPDEFNRLVAAARERPLVNYTRKVSATPSAEKARELRLLGQQRAAAYTVAGMAGLRRGELRRLRWADVDLDGEPPTLTIRAETAKGKRRDTLPLAAPVVDALREWWAAKAQATWAKPKPSDPIFDCLRVNYLRALRADARHAGVALVTAEGRLDLHALRHTCATMLVNTGAPLPTAQKLLRHTDSRLTAEVYAHVLGSDMTEAVARLADLLAAPVSVGVSVEKAVGT